jgi:hypothetical protein
MSERTATKRGFDYSEESVPVTRQPLTAARLSRWSLWLNIGFRWDLAYWQNVDRQPLHQRCRPSLRYNSFERAKLFSANIMCRRRLTVVCCETLLPGDRLPAVADKSSLPVCLYGEGAKLTDIVGLYLDPPAHAVVLSLDEKSQIQALDRTQPGLPIKPGRCQTMTHDYKRHGTTTLFAALSVLDGTVIGRCMPAAGVSAHPQLLRSLPAMRSTRPVEIGDKPVERAI